jgi:hypothetical protein
VKFYMPMKVLPWKSLEVVGSGVKISNKESFGFIPIFESGDQAKKEFPGVQIMELETDEPTTKESA